MKDGKLRYDILPDLSSCTPHPKLSPAPRREQFTERCVHVTSVPGSFPPVGQTPLTDQPNGNVHVPQAMSRIEEGPGRPVRFTIMKASSVWAWGLPIRETRPSTLGVNPPL